MSFERDYQVLRPIDIDAICIDDEEENDDKPKVTPWGNRYTGQEGKLRAEQDFASSLGRAQVFMNSQKPSAFRDEYNKRKEFEKRYASNPIAQEYDISSHEPACECDECYENSGPLGDYEEEADDNFFSNPSCDFKDYDEEIDAA